MWGCSIVNLCVAAGRGETGRQSEGASTRNSGHGATGQASTQPRGEGAVRKAQGLELLTPAPPLTPRNSGQEHGEDAHGRGGKHTHAKAADIGRGRAHRSHTRHSPVSWRQTRCEKERSRGLRHLYMVRPHPRGKGRSQHTTPLSQFTPRRLHQAPVQSPSLPPTSRGPWAMYAQPTDERWAARACSSRSRGGRERVGGGRERALPRFQGSGSLSTVPGLPPGRGESSFCMNYSPHSWGVGRRGGGRVRTSRSFPLYHSHFNCKDRDWGVPLPRPQPCRLAGSGPTPRAAGCTGAGASPAPALPAPSDWREV